MEKTGRQERSFISAQIRQLDNLQAAILNVKLKYFAGWIRRRRQIADIYREGLANVRQLRLPHFSDSRNFDVYMNYAIRAESRDDLCDLPEE